MKESKGFVQHQNNGCFKVWSPFLYVSVALTHICTLRLMRNRSSLLISTPSSLYHTHTYFALHIQVCDISSHMSNILYSLVPYTMLETPD